ncbi:MAG: signal recognition particle protein [Verrucomicrobiota bacterium]|nr:signal recognition particle protein [Verrucomicrobiota bacterium]
MFGTLTEKFQNLFTSLSGKKVLSEENIAEATREVRLALLEADVNYQVVSRFIQRVKEKALGGAVLKSVTPGQQFIQLIHEELSSLMGSEEAPLDLGSKGLGVVMLCGLQGSGKTTSTAKLASYMQKKMGKKRLLLAGCDLQRPAAVEQLRVLSASVGADFFSLEGASPVRVAREAREKALREGYEVLIVDTAGRVQTDEPLMKELAEIKRLVEPKEVLFVASAATGQDAVKVAAEFHQKVGITGTILTMLDGTARAGAAISIREVTEKPLKFEGIGEKVGDLQLFNPRSMADRILGMGDVINLVKKAQDHFDEKESRELEEKARRASFTYADYLNQLGKIKKMGSFSSLLKMLPGVGGMMEQLEGSDREFARMEAMMLSMTRKEREEKDELTPSRRKRIAQGSGVSVEEVNRLVKGFKQMKQMMKEMMGGKGPSSFRDMKKQLDNQQLGKKWR